jgi:hypothetical protein
MVHPRRILEEYPSDEDIQYLFHTDFPTVSSLLRFNFYTTSVCFNAVLLVSTLQITLKNVLEGTYLNYYLSNKVSTNC